MSLEQGRANFISGREAVSATHESMPLGGAVAEETPALQVERILAMTPEAEEFLAELSRRSGLREGR